MKGETTMASKSSGLELFALSENLMTELTAEDESVITGGGHKGCGFGSRSGKGRGSRSGKGRGSRSGKGGCFFGCH
jgi:hypothetical protein